MKKNLEIERLRGIAILLAVFNHAPLNTVFPWFSGVVGVHLFFAVSGFVITASLLRTTITPGVFFVNRLFRLAPMALLTMALSLFAASTFNRVGVWDSPKGVLSEIFQTLTLNYNFHVYEHARRNLIYFWSLNVEEHFYLVLPFALLVFQGIKSRLFVLGSLILSTVFIFRPWLLSLAATDQEYFGLHFRTYMHFDTLGSGVAVALLGAARARKFNAWSLAQKLGAKVITFGLLALLVLTHRLFATFNPWSWTVASLAAVALVLAATFEAGSVSAGTIVNRLLEYLGSRSYCIYLLHLGIWWGFEEVFYREPALKRWYVLPEAALAWAVVVLIAAELCHRLVEQPGIRLGKELIPKLLPRLNLLSLQNQIRTLYQQAVNLKARSWLLALVLTGPGLWELVELVSLESLDLALARLAFVISLGAFLFRARPTIAGFAAATLAPIALILTVTLALGALHLRITGAALDLRVLTEHLAILWPTAVQSWGALCCLVLMIALLVGSVLLCFGVACLMERLSLGSIHRPQNLLLCALLAARAGSDLWYAADQWQAHRARQDELALIEAVQHDLKPLQPSAQSPNVFILKLESLNGLALNRSFRYFGKNYQPPHLPVLEAARAKGAYFPYFLGNSVQSHHAYESLLCAIDGNLSTGFSERPQELRSPCLPRVFQDAGYDTMFAYGYPDTSFFNYANFLPAIGFAEILDKTSLQLPDSKLLKWGYDDCALYDAAFKLLNARQSPRPFFTVFDVSSHHYPFHRPQEFRRATKYPAPENFLEHYLNSAREQDACFGRFLTYFQKQWAHNTHLIVVGDHSYPVGLSGSQYNQVGADAENFITSLLYLPPTSQASRFALGSTLTSWHSQTELADTILELVDQVPRKHSFAPELFAKATTRALAAQASPPARERCHILIQPFDGGHIAIVRQGIKRTYGFRARTIKEADLNTDPLELRKKTLARGVSFWAFKRKYGCPEQN